MKQIVISAPFGNYINLVDAERTRGSFTLHPRKGIIKQSLKTIRPIKQGWVNKIGLRNPGITEGIVKGSLNDIYSIATVNYNFEWDLFIRLLPHNIRIELNVGCPNVGEVAITDGQLHQFSKFNTAILKVPGEQKLAWEYIQRGYDAGIRKFHITNTIPVERGGESGRRIQQISLPLIAKTTAYYNDVHVVGGGGIYSIEDVKNYANVGTDSFALGTIWFTPWRVPKVLKYIRSLNRPTK